MNMLGSLKTRLRSIPRSVLLGVGGVALAFIASAGIYAAALPWSGAADSSRHVDYVYSMYHGQLSDPWHTRYDISLENPKDAADVPRSFPNGSSAHPPLHYAIMAVFSGGLLEANNWQSAIAVMRLVDIIIGLGCVALLAWAGWRLGGRHRQYFAVAVPAFSALITPFIIVAADVYNDPLTVLLATATLALTAVALKVGPSWKLIAALSVLCSLGMLTKVSFASTLLLAVFFVGVGFLIHVRNRLKATGLAIAAALVVAASVAASSGWFYLRNHELSGSWFRSYPKFEIVGREHQTFWDVLTNPGFWGVLPTGLLGIRTWENVLPINKSLSLALFLVAMAGFIYVAIKLFGRWRHSRGKYSKQDLILVAIIALMVLQVVALYAQQLQHSIGWGLLNPRYFITGLLPIGLFFALASLAAGRLRAHLVAAAVLIYGLAAPLNLAYVRGGVQPGDNVFSKLSDLLVSNGVTPILLYVLLGLILLAVIMVFRTVRDIDKDETVKLEETKS